jgi:hypothetical protein
LSLFLESQRRSRPGKAPFLSLLTGFLQLA